MWGLRNVRATWMPWAGMSCDGEDRDGIAARLELQGGGFGYSAGVIPRRRQEAVSHIEEIPGHDHIEAISIYAYHSCQEGYHIWTASAVLLSRK